MKAVAAALAVFVAMSATAIAADAHAQSRIPGAQVTAAAVRAYLGCSIGAQGYLSLRNTTSATLRIGTPVYWTGTQQGQPPRQYSAPLYADVAPGGVYQIGGAYRYDPRAPCQVWIMRRPVATRAP
jgi:hypothetical protein